ncbi:MAG: PQQ-like beta-propeller repeat protein [Thermoguttaceae bacterium]|nr:PQQ-like beta-propeller repeat protein [Thermoguttaceae bacterium]MDW8078453.1 PQQ-binding-like beta-propeller repeat protein [Thermoguttaceae bacterium]
MRKLSQLGSDFGTEKQAAMANKWKRSCQRLLTLVKKAGACMLFMVKGKGARIPHGTLDDFRAQGLCMFWLVWFLIILGLGFVPFEVVGAGEPQVDAAPGDTWPRFRGPNGRGERDDVRVPLEWTGGIIRWQVDLPGVGHSSPIVWGDLVYVTSALPEDATQILRAYRAEDGSLVWEKRYPSRPHRVHSFNCYASSTPAVDEKRIYWAWGNPEELVVVALDRTSGRELWRQRLGPFVAEHGFGASPIVADGLVILPNEQDGESCVVALEASTGQLVWRTPRRSEKTAYSTPAVLAPAGREPQIVLTSWAHGISVLDLHTGKPVWELPVFRFRVVASPFVADRFIFASSGEGGVGRQLVVVRYPAEVGQQPTKVLELAQDIPYVPTPVAAGDLVFLWSDRGVVSCVELKQMAVLWKERLGGQYFASPVRTGDQIFNISRQGEVVILRAARRFEVLSRFNLAEGTHATPAIARDNVFVRTYSRLLAVPTLPVQAK